MRELILATVAGRHDSAKVFLNVSQLDTDEGAESVQIATYRRLADSLEWDEPEVRGLFGKAEAPYVVDIDVKAPIPGRGWELSVRQISDLGTSRLVSVVGVQPLT
jgi:hypothetical protein